MADLQIPESVTEVGKFAGSGGLGFFLAKMADRFFNKSDKDAGKLDQLLAAVHAFGGQLAVAVERQTTTRADVDRLESAFLVVQLQLAELKGQFQHLNEQLLK